MLEVSRVTASALAFVAFGALCFSCAISGPGSQADELSSSGSSSGDGTTNDGSGGSGSGGDDSSLSGSSGSSGSGASGDASSDATTGSASDDSGSGSDTGDDSGSGSASDDSGSGNVCVVSACPTAPCLNMTTPCCKKDGSCGCGGTLVFVPYCI